MANTKKRRRRMTTKEKVISAFVIIIGLAIIIALGWLAVSNWKPFETQKPIANHVLLGKNSGSAADGKKPDTNVGEQINILCLGFDEEEKLTDVMMLVSLDTGSNKVSILQIPRDCYVGDWDTGKINAAYCLGGSEESVQNVVDVINSKFQLPVDYYVTIGCNDIAACVDAVGGIPMNVPETLNYPGTYKYDGNRPTIYKGEQTLDGEAAQWFVRYRAGYTEGDIGREDAQRVFFAAAVQKAKSMGLKEVVNVMPAITKNLSTNLTIGEMKDLAEKFLKVDMANFSIYRIPGEGANDKEYHFNGYDLYSIHAEETAQLLNNYFRPYQDDVPASELGIYEIANTVDMSSGASQNFQSIINGEPLTSETSSEDGNDSVNNENNNEGYDENNDEGYDENNDEY